MTEAPDDAAQRRRNIRLLVSYDGTDFLGWQRQTHSATRSVTDNTTRDTIDTRTVQGAIETALAKIHKTPVTLTGSGRTDTGVHAAGQVANFYTTIQSIDPARFVPALNSLLPRDIRILDARQTRDDFHARFDARLRTYRYYCITRQNAAPWELRYAWHLRRHPDIERLNDYARLLIGEMDCTTFAIPTDKSKTRSRYIAGARFFIENDRLIFEISANAFLWRMVRSVTGTLLRCEETSASTATFRHIIAAKTHALAGPTAPPQGLFLWKIDYYRD